MSFRILNSATRIYVLLFDGDSCQDCDPYTELKHKVNKKLTERFIPPVLTVSLNVSRAVAGCLLASHGCPSSDHACSCGRRTQSIPSDPDLAKKTTGALQFRWQSMANPWSFSQFFQILWESMRHGYWLVVDIPLWKIWKSVGMIIPNIWQNKTCSKPPIRLYHVISYGDLVVIKNLATSMT